MKRAFLLSNGEAAKSGPKQLMVVLHGRRDAAASNRSSPRLDELARTEGFVVAYPAGLEGRWNYPAQPTAGSKAGAEPADDVGFIGRLLDVLAAEKIVEPKRIYVSGFSNGAFLTFGLMCTMSERIAAAAAMGASMTEAQIAACKPARPVPFLSIAGTDDGIVPYDGRLYEGYRLTSVPETLEFWRRLHQCTGQKGNTLDKRAVNEPTRTVVIDWTGCASEHAMRFYRIEGGGHTLPSLTPQTPEDAAKNGRRSADFETSDVVWAFLKRRSLP